MSDPSRPTEERAFWLGLLVAAQRRPWAGAAVAAFAVLHAFALPFALVGTRFQSPVTRAGAGALAACVAAHAVARSTSWLERVAALVVSNSVVIALGLGDVVISPTRAADAAVPLGGVAFAVLWALAVPHDPRPPRAIRVAELLAVAALAAGAAVAADIGRATTIAAILGFPVVFGAFLRSEERASTLAGWGGILGLALGAVHLGVALDRVPPPATASAVLTGSALAGAVFGLLAAAARSARSFTAVPRDHPSITDFVRGSPREAA